MFSLLFLWQTEGEEVKILAIDQARSGAWAVFDYENKTLETYGTFSYGYHDYTFAQAVLQIEGLIETVIKTYGISAVFIEDIQMRVNAQSFKKLAQLQGVLVNLCEKNHFAYWYVAPPQWQNFCRARGRSEKEIREKIKSIEATGKKRSKALSIEMVHELYGIDTENDNLADAILQGHYVVNRIKITAGENGSLHIEQIKQPKRKRRVRRKTQEAAT